MLLVEPRISFFLIPDLLANGVLVSPTVVMKYPPRLLHRRWEMKTTWYLHFHFEWT